MVLIRCCKFLYLSGTTSSSMPFLRCLLLVFLLIPVLLFGQRGDDRIMVDTTARDVHSFRINGSIYTGVLKQDSFYLYDGRGRILLRLPSEYLFSFEFKDYNGDGYRDLVFEVSSNVPEMMDVYLYSPSRRGFRELKDARKFPAPIRIKGTPYYYSYHKGGCADMVWASDLFYIHNSAAVALGNIQGEECKTEEGVYIYKIRAGKKRLVKKLPIKTIYTYKGGKWGFIDAYWKKYYKQFC